MLYVLFNPHTLLLYIVCALCGFNMWLFYYLQEIKRKKKPLTRDKINCGKKNILPNNKSTITFLIHMECRHLHHHY